MDTEGRTDNGELLTRSIIALTAVMMRVETAIGWLAVSVALLVLALVFHWEGVL